MPTTSQPTVFIATYESLPELYWDERPLIDELATRSIRAIPAVWTDDSIQWEQADLVIVRSCWDSHLDPSHFLSWLHKVEQLTTVANDPDIIRWCFHKTYLKELEAKGISIVPTRWLEQGTPVDLGKVLAEQQWPSALIKPSISADGYLTARVNNDDPLSIEKGQQVIDRLLSDRGVMVQPYMQAFDENRETSLTFIDGRFSHAYRRPSLLVHGEEYAVGQRTLVEASDALIELAEQILALISPVMYARVDILDIENPMLNEIDVIDPNLLMSFSPDGICYRWLADAIEEKLNAL